MTAGADVNSTTFLGGTALHTAVKLQNLPLVALLLSRGADPSIVDGVGISPITYAVWGDRNPDLLEALVSAGCAVPTLASEANKGSPEQRVQRIVSEKVLPHLDTQVKHWLAPEGGYCSAGLSAEVETPGV